MASSTEFNVVWNLPKQAGHLPMNSVLRRSLRSRTVLHRQLWISRPISQPRRQYSTHNPDASKDKSAVGVRPLGLGHLSVPPHAPFPPC